MTLFAYLLGQVPREAATGQLQIGGRRTTKVDGDSIYRRLMLYWGEGSGASPMVQTALRLGLPMSPPVRKWIARRAAEEGCLDAEMRNLLDLAAAPGRRP